MGQLEKQINKAFNFIVIALFTAAIISCHRQKIYDTSCPYALIPVLIDWESKALLDINNDPDDDLYSASVWLFPTEQSSYQGSPLEYRIQNAVHDVISIPIGIYKVLIFNKTTDDYSDNVGFRGIDSYDDFEYYVLYDTSSSLFSDITDEEVKLLEPELLAAWSMSGDEVLEISSQMVSYADIVDSLSGNIVSKSSYQEISVDDYSTLPEELKQLVGVAPKRLTHIVKVDKGVTNLNSAKSAQGRLYGMCGSVKLASGVYSNQRGIYTFQYTDRKYNSGSTTDGVIEAEFNVIGRLGSSEQEYNIETLFTLASDYDNSTTYPTPPQSPFNDDVTDQIEGNHLGLDLYIDITIDQNAELPEIATGSDDSFNLGVDDWDEEVNLFL